MTRVHFVKKSRKDYPDFGIKKGDSYYWWSFKFGPTLKSKIQPKLSQLTQSEFLGSIYDISDRIESLSTYDDLESEVSEIISELETLRDDCEEKRSNMPEQLQDSGSGEILQNRVDSVQEMIDELEGINTEIEEPTDEEVKDDIGEKEQDETKERYEERLEERREEMSDDRKEEILTEIQNISYNGE